MVHNEIHGNQVGFIRSHPFAIEEESVPPFDQQYSDLALAQNGIVDVHPVIDGLKRVPNWKESRRNKDLQALDTSSYGFTVTANPGSIFTNSTRNPRLPNIDSSYRVDEQRLFE
jgi:hypothetical protein